jgi:opacity protein-like surface antigen
MRWTIFLALAAALLLAPAAARAASPTTILKDCEDDSQLEGHYSLTDLKNARNHLSGDLSEYSDCSDVLSQAIAQASAHTQGSGGGNSNSNGSAAPPPSSGGGGGSSSGGAHRKAETPQVSQNFVVGASTPKDFAAVKEAQLRGGDPLVLDGRDVAPSAHTAATIGRNALPITLILALVLLAAAALAATAPLVRRRVIAHRQP